MKKGIIAVIVVVLAAVIVDRIYFADVEEAPQTRAVSLPPPAPVVKAERHDEKGNVWIDAYHEGYRAQYGLIHRRRIYLGSGGGDLRGEDILTASGKPSAAPLPFDVRFHLHPDVDVSILGDGQAALLRLARGAGWTFKVRGGALKLDESLYLGQRGEVRRSEQLVVSGAIDGGQATVNWSFTRVGGPGQASDAPEGEG